MRRCSSRARASARHPRLERDRARRATPPEPDPRRHRDERQDDDDASSSARCSARPDGPSRSPGNVGRPLTSLVGTVVARRVDRLRALVVPARGRRTRCSRASRVLLNLEPDHLDRHGTFECVRRREAPDLRAPDARTTPRSCRAASAPVPGAARRVEFAARRPAPGRAAHPRAAQPRERRRRDRRRARGRHRRRRDRARRCAPSRASPHRIELVRELARRPLRQRLEGDERRRCASRARVVPRRRACTSSSAAAASTSRTRRSPRRSGPGDRAYLIGEAAEEIARALAAAGVPTSRTRATSRLQSTRRERRVGRRRRAPLAGVRELRPVPRLRGARRRVPRARGGARVKGDGHARPAPRRVRHARARRVRARDGLQRDVGVGRARQRRPDELPQAPGGVRAHRRRLHDARGALRLPPPSLPRAAARCSSRSSSAPPCSCSGRRSTARAAGSSSARRASSRPSSRSSRSASSPPSTSRAGARRGRSASS